MNLENLTRYRVGWFGCCHDCDVTTAMRDGEWVKFKDVVELLEHADNSHVMQLLCDVKGLLLNNDTPSREARSEIIRVINAVLAQQS